MELTNEYQLIGKKSLTYGELRTYAKLESRDVNEITRTYKVKSVYYSSYYTVNIDNSSNTLDGEYKEFGYTSFAPGETVIQEITRTIKHNEDGTSPTKSITNAWSATFGGSATVTSTITFPKIEKLNTITVNEGTLFSVDTNENVSNEIPVTITKYVDSYTSKLKITMENNLEEQTVIRDYIDFDSDNLTFTTEELTKIYNNTNFKFIVLIFDLDSYEGSTTIGTYSIRVPATLSDTDLYPTFTTTFTELNDKVIALLGTSANTIVQNASVLNVKVNPTAHKGSTISKVQIIHNQIPTDITTAPYEKQILAVNGVFDATVTDSRENSTTEQYRKNTIEYTPIDITEIDFKRQSMTSSNLYLTAKIKYKQATFGTTKNVPTIQYKKGVDGTLKTLSSSLYSIDEDNNLIIINKALLENVISYKEKDDIYLVVSDLLTTDEDHRRILKGVPTFDYGEYDFQVNGQLFVADENRENKKEVATKDDIPNVWEDITEKDHKVITYASDIDFSYKKMYRIASKFIYFVCAGVKATASTTITIGNINESYRPPLTTYIGGCGPESKPITVSASVNGDIIARLTSAGTWFGFSIMWAIN